MGNRFFIDRMEKANARFHGLWSSPHIGRFFKRKLSKARRRAWKDKRERGLASAESEANYKNW